MTYHVQAEINVRGDDSILTAVSGLKAATIFCNTSNPVKVIAVSSGRPRMVGLISPYPMPGAGYDERLSGPLGEAVEGQAVKPPKVCQIHATLDCGDVPDAVAAVVAVDVIVHEMQDWYRRGALGAAPGEFAVELGSVNALTGPVDMFEKMPELMKLMGKYMRRGIDRGDGDEWKSDDEQGWSGDDDAAQRGAALADELTDLVSSLVYAAPEMRDHWVGELTTWYNEHKK